ncbi:AAA family ATPase [Nakamurella silvestris]|nr:AAA family ATPase [Nakamurella silvestris]
MSEDFQQELRRLLHARFPVLSVQTSEELRLLGDVTAAVAGLGGPGKRRIFQWSTSVGLTPDVLPGTRTETFTPHAALAAVSGIAGPCVVLMYDLHPWMGSNVQPPDTQLVRALKDLAQSFRDGEAGRTLILVSPTPRIPADLQSVVTILDYPLPTEEYLRTVLDGMITRNTRSGALTVDLGDTGAEQLTKAALGLTAFEAENAFARAMVDDSRLTVEDVAIVQQEKRQIIRKAGTLEVVDSNISLSDVGGLENLKTWLTKRSGSWLDEARSYGLPAPKGLLVTGIPGCGKSLTAKAMAGAWGLPLVRLDIGRIFGGLVGASEQNMREALRTAEAISPCVLWIDEIEKGFSAGASAVSDGGTSARVFGYFLTWMQEKTATVFVMATANNISLLPPEFLRKGRFDEIFFIDLPTTTERRVIFRIHLKARLKAGPALGALTVDDALLDELAAATEGLSGAEIEQAVISACYEAFDRRRELTKEDVLAAIAATVPLSVTQAEQIGALRAWADVRAITASAPDDRAGYLTTAAPIAVPVEATLQRGGRE